MARDTYHHGDLREQLVALAVDRIGREGAEGFSLRAGCQALGVDPAAAYRHFENRLALIEAVADRAFDMMSATMRRELSRRRGAPPEELMIAVGLGYVTFALDHPQLFRVAFSTPRHPGQRPGVVRPTSHELLVQRLDALEAVKRLDPPGRERAAHLAWSAVHGYACLRLDGMLPTASRRRVRAEVRALCRAVIAGLPASADA